MHLEVKSESFGSMEVIPAEFTCDGNDVSPQISWKNTPMGTKSIAIICDDPDAPSGTWVHWVCYDIPAVTSSLHKNIMHGDTLPCTGKQGITDFGKNGYNGPCPPSGVHRYFFKVYALDAFLNLPAGKTARDVEKTMKGHVLGYGELVGMYSRKSK
jgi:Raf kinase inhibitor-like YbhB/YbcL family protein